MSVSLIKEHIEIIEELQVGKTMRHAGKHRKITSIHHFGNMTRVWLEFDSSTERSGYEGYVEISHGED